jgi:hypothetical protein
MKHCWLSGAVLVRSGTAMGSTTLCRGEWHCFNVSLLGLNLASIVQPVVPWTPTSSS